MYGQQWQRLTVGGIKYNILCWKIHDPKVMCSLFTISHYLFLEIKRTNPFAHKIKGKNEQLYNIYSFILLSFCTLFYFVEMPCKKTEIADASKSAFSLKKITFFTLYFCFLLLFFADNKCFLSNYHLDYFSYFPICCNISSATAGSNAAKVKNKENGMSFPWQNRFFKQGHTHKKNKATRQKIQAQKRGSEMNREKESQY